MNFQICYFHPQNAKGEAMNLLSFGFRQFTETYLYQNQKKLKSLCDNVTSSPPKIEDVKDFALNHLIDSIKIHICFENFIKGVFLANNIVVHELDKDIFSELSKKQKKEPVHLSEILAIVKWSDNPKIRSDNPNVRQQIEGIKKRTLGTNILTKSGYTNAINISEETLKLLKPYFEYRNNLHYYSGDSFTLSKSLYKNFRGIIDFVNNDIVRIHNMIIDDLEKGNSYKLPKI